MMKFKFSDSYGNDVTYEIHDSELGHALERMLPLTVILNQIGSSEMSFVPPKKLSTFGAPIAPGGIEGLCYHEPWNEVILYYGGYSQYENLYEIGMLVAGQGAVRNLHGPVKIEEIY